MKVFTAAIVAIQICVTFAQNSLMQETEPMVWASKLVYTIGKFVKAARQNKFQLEIPEGFPVDELTKFKDEAIDFIKWDREDNNNGIPFAKMMQLINANKHNLGSLAMDETTRNYVRSILEKIEVYEAQKEGDSLYLATYRSIQQKVSCVYGVVKDIESKQIIVAFRGSQNPDFSTRDWRSNINAQMTDLKTPTLIKDKMKGKLKERLLVHKGFYDYLFNNKRIKGDQRYDSILKDIEAVFEDGYTIIVTGHSLGGALASMFAFKIAGSSKSWIPKPIKCITFASPINGSSGFRTAFEQLEQDGLIKYLRITNDKDLVPSIPPNSLGLKLRALKHVGINLRLRGNGKEPIITHSSRGGFMTAIQNTFLKPFWSVLHYHGMPLHEERLKEHCALLSSLSIDGLYADKSIVGDSFDVKVMNRDEL